MQKKYQVFVSSTYTDLIDERVAVMQCLLDNDCIPVGMEQFPASGMKQMDYIKKMLDDCDYYILILAGRYGSLDEDGIGFTEKEFDYAVSKNIPIMSFVINTPESISMSNSEKTEDGQTRLENFRHKVCAGRMVKFHDNIYQLTTNVVTSINRCIKDFPALGWIRGCETATDTNLDLQIEKYLETHTITPEDISAIINDTSNNTLKEPLATQAFISEQYMCKDMKGYFSFDYSNNNGEFIIGSGENTFVTKWSKASNKNIHAYKDGNGILEIARIKAPIELQDALKQACDFSSRCRTPNIGDIIVWKNKYEKYAATKILHINDDTRGDEHDELGCEYLIFD